MSQDRRRFLQTLALGAALPIVPRLMGCGSDTNYDATGADEVRVPLGMLPAGGRLHVTLAGDTVELTRLGDDVIARSLVCTHQGCIVEWVTEENAYVCPCHEGKFNAEGEPVYGVPRRPLEVFDVTREGNELVVRS